MKKLTKAQIGMYWGEWAKVRKILTETQGLSAEDADAERKAIHKDILGEEISVRDIQNKQLDKLIGAFRAVSRPDDHQAQLKAREGEEIRIRKLIKDLKEELGLTDRYISGICAHVAKTRYELCSPGDLRKILAALNYHKKRILKETSEQ